MLASGGTIAAPITAALTTAVTSGASVTVTRNTDSGCSGWLQQLDITKVIGTVTAGDAAVWVLRVTGG